MASQVVTWNCVEIATCETQGARGIDPETFP